MDTENHLQMADAMPVMVWMANEVGQSVYFNPQWLAFTGRTLQEQLASDWTDLIHPDDRESYAEGYRAACDAREALVLVYRLRRHDEAYRWIQDHSAPRFSADGGFAGFMSVCVDVTDHRQATAERAGYHEHLERLLDARTAQLRQERLEHERTVDALAYESDFAENLIDTAPVIIMLLDRQGQIARFNRYAEEFSGHFLRDVRGQDWCEVFLPEDQRDRLRNGLLREIDSPGVKMESSKFITKKGESREIAWYARALRDSKLGVLGLLAVGLDITEQKQVEEERKWLSRELHDEAGQALTAIKLSLRALQGDIPVEWEPIQERLNDVASLVDMAMEHLRLLARNLRPPALEIVGLVTTLEEYCRSVSRRAELPINFDYSEIPQLSDAVCIGIYRVLQEALTNIVKHAFAKSVVVGLYYREGAVCLVVEDDGRGIAVAGEDQNAVPGIGLLGMRERLELLGGRLEISARPGGGTRLAVYVPEQGEP